METNISVMELPFSHQSPHNSLLLDGREATPEHREMESGHVQENHGLLGQHVTPNPHAGLPVYMSIHR